MRLTYTSPGDLGRAPFWLQSACLTPWLALVLYLTHRFADDASVMLFLLPTVGFFVVLAIPGIAFDFQGVVFAGTFFCCFFSSAIFGTVLNGAGKDRVADLTMIAFYIAFAMVFGFGLFRLMGKAFQRLS
ncbi:MAG TPA: hypothetical protein VH189_16155 [Rhizomicrobium sp.]|nr:hypothetical protein [Rhizomicrobium sp.]